MKKEIPRPIEEVEGSSKAKTLGYFMGQALVIVFELCCMVLMIGITIAAISKLF